MFLQSAFPRAFLGFGDPLVIYLLLCCFLLFDVLTSSSMFSGNQGLKWYNLLCKASCSLSRSLISNINHLIVLVSKLFSFQLEAVPSFARLSSIWFLAVKTVNVVDMQMWIIQDWKLSPPNFSITITFPIN